jgi:hypothetical protein
MATKQKIILPAPNVVGASKTSLIDLPRGYRYSCIGIEYSDLQASPVDILTAVGDMRLKINSKVNRLHSAAELDVLNKVNGAQYARLQIGSGTTMKQVIVIWFAEPWRKNADDQSRLAFTADARNGVNNFQLEIDLTASATGTPAITAFAVVDAPLPPPASGAALLSKTFRSSVSVAGVSIDIPTLDKGEVLQTLLFRNPTAGAGSNISKVTLKQNGDTKHELTRTQNIGHLTAADMNPSTSTSLDTAGYDVILDADDPVTSGLPTNTNDNLALKVEFAAAASGSMTFLIQRLGTIE